MDYKIQPYTPYNLISFTELLDTSFSIRNKDKIGLVQWKLFHAHHNGNTITYVALDKNGSVVGQYTNLPVTIVHNNRFFKSMICCDMTTHPHHRGKGLISILSQRVYDDVIKRGYDFTVGFSNDDGLKVDKNAHNYGYHIVGAFVRYFKVVVYRKKIKKKTVPVKQFRISDTFGAKTHYLRFYKDHNYLQWRYLSKPNNEYSLYQIVEGDTLTGYVVLRFKEHTCYLYDILVNDMTQEQMTAVLRSIEHIALEKGIRIIVCNILDNMFWQNLFSTHGYLKKPNNKVNYHLTVKIHNPTISSEFLLNRDNWLLLNGDIL